MQTENTEGGVATSQPSPAPARGNLSRLPAVKFVAIAIISIMLLVPIIMVWWLVEERADRAGEVASRIAEGWGGEQTINGPYIVVPTTVSSPQDNGKGGFTMKKETRWVYLMPETLDVDAELTAESRQLSIYSLPVYRSDIGFKGKFSAGMNEWLSSVEQGVPDFSRAFIFIGVTDMRGIRSNAAIKMNGGSELAFEPGWGGAGSGPTIDWQNGYTNVEKTSGMHLPISKDMIENGFDFSMDIVLNGSSAFAVAPAGQTTSLKAKANWPDPGFDGAFLPEEKSISKDGFEAAWTIPYLARGQSKVSVGGVPLYGKLMRVNLVEPLKFYQRVSRTLKYAVGFVGLVFFTFFIMEFRSGRPVHWVQYILTGFALIVFYILLLALAEHTGFAIAYMVSSVAIVLLIGTHTAALTGERRHGLIIGTILGVTYAVMYMVMQEDEYALLAGAIIAFIAVAAAMYTTRNIEWNGHAAAKMP